ncbi:hypothetical protein CC2G_014453 [Coprinopsis cinerea AmutBmut pab1-1]|nr:hypothetical protein CC2G_014453 [Coprinopsis cinerea AmutBmut pab1-1]
MKLTKGNEEENHWRNSDPEHLPSFKAYLISNIGYNSVVSLVPQLLIFRVVTGRSWVKRPDSLDEISTIDIRFRTTNSTINSIPSMQNLDPEKGVNCRSRDYRQVITTVEDAQL